MIKSIASTRGFTLIELSIVLVIIGLIVGGVLLGQSLIGASEVRAQITQIEKYNSAVNTFRSKFNALPGDLPVATAKQFGFTQGNSCNGQQGGRDGNGLIDGLGTGYTLYQAAGETALFWEDLTSAAGGNLIEGQFPNSGAAGINCYGGGAASLSLTPGTGFVGDYFPVAKIGHGNFMYVYEDGTYNWYGVSVVTAVNTSGVMGSSVSISTAQAYSMDAKIDDGLPTSGNVQALYIASINNPTPPLRAAPNTTTSGGTSSSCYDTTTGTYSITINNGSGANCALSFKLQ